MTAHVSLNVHTNQIIYFYLFVIINIRLYLTGKKTKTLISIVETFIKLHEEISYRNINISHKIKSFISCKDKGTTMVTLSYTNNKKVIFV
jgi:hypothetical protein